MQIFSELVPIWVSILFLLVISIPIFLIANLAKKGSSSPQNAKKNYAVVLIFYGIYLAYVTFACFKGLFLEATLPPKILKFTMVPLLLFLMLVIFNLPVFKSILKKLDLSDLVRIHIFRLIGSFFLILGFYKALPSSIALLAGCGDVITAVSSIFVIEETLSFLDLEFYPACLEFENRSPSLLGIGDEIHHQNITKAINENAEEKWKHLDMKTIEKIENKLLQEMKLNQYI